MAGGEPIVIDLGTSRTRAGIFGDVFPRLDVPTCPQRYWKLKSTARFALEDPLSAPFLTDGRLTNPLAVQNFLDDVIRVVQRDQQDKQHEENNYQEQHTTETLELPGVMLTVAQPELTYDRVTSLNPYQELLEWLLLHQGVGKCQILGSPRMALFGVGRVSGLVVDTGCQSCRVCPILEGQVLSQAATNHYPLGGNAITESLQRSLQKSGTHLAIPFFVAEQMKKRSCFVSQNIQKDLTLSEETCCFAAPWKLPDGTTLVIEKERFMAAEVLFAPNFDPSKGSLDEVVGKTFLAAPMDTRKFLLQSMVLSGGPSLMLGFGTRLNHEIRSWYASNIIGSSSMAETLQTGMFIHPDRDDLAFRGASLHGALTFDSDKGWLTREVLEEEGMIRAWSAGH